MKIFSFKLGFWLVSTNDECSHLILSFVEVASGQKFLQNFPKYLGKILKFVYLEGPGKPPRPSPAPSSGPSGGESLMSPPVPTPWIP